MKFSDYWKSLSDGAKTLFLLLGAGFIAFLFYWQFVLKYKFSKKVSKKALARAYKVNPKILRKWIQTFGSPEAKELYAESYVKEVKLVYFTECLGSPRSRPKHNGKLIIFKQDIWEASGKSESTVYKKIKALEDAESMIGMSADTFGSMRIFPPKHVELILAFIKTGERKKSNYLPAYNSREEKPNRKLP